MRWNELSTACKRYLLAVYILAVPTALWCFALPGQYHSQWLLLTVISLFVSTINIRLPRISSVISMGDVFTILALTQFGPGPALIMYSLDMVVGHLANVLRNHGLDGVRRIQVQKIVFNLACCPLSIATMAYVYRSSMNSRLTYPTDFVVGLGGLAIVWFL